MKNARFTPGQIYTKGVNNYKFSGMIGKDYHFLLEDKSPDSIRLWNDIKISYQNTDILDNLK